MIYLVGIVCGTGVTSVIIKACSYFVRRLLPNPRSNFIRVVNFLVAHTPARNGHEHGSCDGDTNNSPSKRSKFDGKADKQQDVQSSATLLPAAEGHSATTRKAILAYCFGVFYIYSFIPRNITYVAYDQGQRVYGS